MKKGVLLGTSVLAAGGVIGGGVLLSGAANSAGDGDKGPEQSEEKVEGGPEEKIASPEKKPNEPTKFTVPAVNNKPAVVLYMNPVMPQDNLDNSLVDEPEEEDEQESEDVPVVVDHVQEPVDSDDQQPLLTDEENVTYTITEPSLMLDESCGNLDHRKLRVLINFLNMENTSFEDNMVDLHKAQQYLDIVIANINSSFTVHFESFNSYTCQGLHLHYRKWLGLWDQKIKAEGSDSEGWKSMRNKYVDKIVKKYFWDGFRPKDSVLLGRASEELSEGIREKSHSLP